MLACWLLGSAKYANQAFDQNTLSRMQLWIASCYNMCKPTPSSTDFTTTITTLSTLTKSLAENFSPQYSRSKSIHSGFPIYLGNRGCEAIGLAVVWNYKWCFTLRLISISLFSFEWFRMATRSLISILFFLLLSGSIIALQVAPDSRCAAICVDEPGQDISNTNNSNTFGSDIVCLDDNYVKTAVGKKYKSCMSCLQESSTTSSGESDQSWFLCE